MAGTVLFDDLYYFHEAVDELSLCEAVTLESVSKYVGWLVNVNEGMIWRRYTIEFSAGWDIHDNQFASEIGKLQYYRKIFKFVDNNRKQVKMIKRFCGQHTLQDRLNLWNSAKRENIHDFAKRVNNVLHLYKSDYYRIFPKLSTQDKPLFDILYEELVTNAKKGSFKGFHGFAKSIKDIYARGELVLPVALYRVANENQFYKFMMILKNASTCHKCNKGLPEDVYSNDPEIEHWHDMKYALGDPGTFIPMPIVNYGDEYDNLTMHKYDLVDDIDGW